MSSLSSPTNIQEYNPDSRDDMLELIRVSEEHLENSEPRTQIPQPISQFTREISRSPTPFSRSISHGSSSSSEYPDNNYVNLNTKCISFFMTPSQLLENVYKLCDNVFARETGGNNTPHLLYSKTSMCKHITISNIMFEINRIKYMQINIYDYENATNSPTKIGRYTVSLSYRSIFSHNEHRVISESDSLEEAFQGSLANAKMMKMCENCPIPYNTRISECCPCCLFSNFYTSGNDLITCAICKEQTRDFVTLDCGHRFDLKCLQRCADEKCPCCRQPFEITQ
jgi:hypothetical protein